MPRTDSNDPCESVVLAHPTIDRLQNFLAAESTEVRRNTIRRFLRREGRRFWKKPCSPARPDPSEGPGENLANRRAPPIPIVWTPHGTQEPLSV